MNKLLSSALLLITFNAAAWEVDLHNPETGEYSNVVIDSVHSYGSVIEIDTYRPDTGEYGNVVIDSIHSYGDEVEIETYDYNSGDYTIYDVDNW